MHEDFSRAHAVKLSSNRTFGLVWTAFLFLYGLAPLRHGHGVRVWSIEMACGLLLLSLLAPRSLQIPNELWAKIGLLLSRLVNPVVMAVIYAVCFVPVGIVNRIRKKDPLHLRFDPSASTYWINRESSDSPRASMNNQF
jgi:hypothetical protein